MTSRRTDRRIALGAATLGDLARAALAAGSSPAPAAARTCTTSRSTSRCEPSAFFADGRVAPAAGRRHGGARARCSDDEAFYTGKVGGDAGPTTFPFPVDAAVLERGQERFNIYCTPCHGRTGAATAWSCSAAIGSRRRSTSTGCGRRRAGYIFDVITNGFGAMPDYAAQIDPRDRWAIVAYVRALQLSQARHGGGHARRRSRRANAASRPRSRPARSAGTDDMATHAVDVDRRAGPRPAQQRALIVGAGRPRRWAPSGCSSTRDQFFRS